MKILFIVLLVIFIAYVWVENKFLLKIKTETFNQDINSLKIVHLTDLHKKTFGIYNTKLVKKTRLQQPDIIVFSGDLISRSCTNLSDIEKFIENLSKIAPIYYTVGNHELYIREHYPHLYSELIHILQKNDVHILDNSSENIVHNDRNIQIYGASLKLTVYKKDGGYSKLDDYTVDELYENIGYPTKEATNILIAHNPFFAKEYAEWGADFTLCGHVHGGAVVIPFVNTPLLSPERKFFPKYAKGVFNIGKMKLLVSGGLGKFRIFNPSEIVVYYV